jgi:hypothetical protein
MLHVALLASLVAYSFVASQPLFYLVALGRAQRALSAPAYIELRQRINPVMSRRVPAIYGSALATAILLLVLALRAGDRAVLAAAAVSLACLVVDAVFMLRENVPINSVVDGWSATAYPADWEDYRRKWFASFGTRQILLLVGFAGLLLAAVFGS